jgi:hypothetical protein
MPMSSDTFELVQAARRCAEAAWPKGAGIEYGLTKAGVMLDDLLPIEDRPLTLFDRPHATPRAAMMALDQINRRFGKKQWCWLVRGCSGLGNCVPIIGVHGTPRGFLTCQWCGESKDWVARSGDCGHSLQARDETFRQAKLVTYCLNPPTLDSHHAASSSLM